MIGRRGLLAARWGLLAALACAAAAAVVVTRRDRQGSSATETYRCPMHPAVVSSSPGECPICRMALVPAAAIAREAPGAAAADETARGAYIVRAVAFTDNVRAPAWVESPGTLAAHLYLDEVESLEAGARGAFAPSTAPASAIDATLAPGPAAPWDGSTALVRLQLDAGAELPTGTAGWLRFAPKLRRATLVPSSAVLQSPEGPYVFARSGDAWEPRAVRLGKFFSGNAVVLTGLREHEAIALNGLFFLDAERRLGRAASDGASEAPAR